MLKAIQMKNNYVLVKEIIEENITKSGIIIPTEKYNRMAKVIKSGCDSVKENDTIIKTIGKGTTYTFEDEEYEILHENHILAVIEEDATKTTST